MVQTRSKSGAAPKQPDPDISLQNTFSNQSLLAWSTGSRTNTKSGISRKQQRAPLLDLPLDLLAIIFSSCHPSSILQLGRTCIDLKLFLHSKASKPIWIASREALSFSVTEDEAKAVKSNKSGTFRLPDCPSYLSEAEYAAFCFDTACGYCGEEDGSSNTGSLLVRACVYCRQQFVSLQYLQDEWNDDCDPRLYRIVPSTNPDSAKKKRITKRIYHKSTSQAIFERVFRYEIEVKFDGRALNSFFQRGEEEIKKREALQHELKKFRSMESVYTKVQLKIEKRQAEERYLRNRAFAAERLNREGYETLETDIDDSHSASRIITGNLADNTFAGIKSDLLKSLEPMQTHRRYITAYYDPANIQSRAVLDDFRRTLPQIDSFPRQIRLPDFMELPSCKALAADLDFINGPEEAQKAIWAGKLNDVLEEVKIWVTEKENSILALLKEDRKTERKAAPRNRRYIYDIHLCENYLYMPFNVFICPRCKALLSELPDILVHDCYTAYHPDELPYTRRRLRNDGIDISGAFNSPINVENGILYIGWERTFTAKQIYDALLKAGEEAPQTPAELRNKAGTIRCAQCPKGSAERTGTTVALSYAHHLGDIYSKPKTHRKFKYIPASNENQEAAGDDDDVAGIAADAASLEEDNQDESSSSSSDENDSQNV